MITFYKCPGAWIFVESVFEQILNQQSHQELRSNTLSMLYVHASVLTLFRWKKIKSNYFFSENFKIFAFIFAQVVTEFVSLNNSWESMEWSFWTSQSRLSFPSIQKRGRSVIRANTPKQLLNGPRRDIICQMFPNFQSQLLQCLKWLDVRWQKQRCSFLCTSY